MGTSRARNPWLASVTNTFWPNHTSSPISIDSWATTLQRSPITQRSPMTRARGGTVSWSGE